MIGLGVGTVAAMIAAPLLAAPLAAAANAGLIGASTKALIGLATAVGLTAIGGYMGAEWRKTGMKNDVAQAEELQRQQNVSSPARARSQQQGLVTSQDMALMESRMRGNGQTTSFRDQVEQSRAQLAEQHI